MVGVVSEVLRVSAALYRATRELWRRSRRLCIEVAHLRNMGVVCHYAQPRAARGRLLAASDACASEHCPPYAVGSGSIPPPGVPLTPPSKSGCEPRPPSTCPGCQCLRLPPPMPPPTMRCKASTSTPLHNRPSASIDAAATIFTPFSRRRHCSCKGRALRPHQRSAPIESPFQSFPPRPARRSGRLPRPPSKCGCRRPPMGRRPPPGAA